MEGEGRTQYVLTKGTGEVRVERKEELTDEVTGLTRLGGGARGNSWTM